MNSCRRAFNAPRRSIHAVATPTVLALLLGLLGLSGLFGCSAQADRDLTPLDKLPRDKAVVLIDDTEISGAWLFNWCARYEIQMLSSGLPYKIDEHSLIEAGRDMLTKIIVIAKEAERTGIEVSDQEIDDQIASEMSQFESTEEWKEQLASSGISLDERREQIRLEMLFNKYRDNVIAPRVREEKVTDELARQVYETTDESNLTVAKQVHLFHLLRSVSKDAPQSERERELKAIRQAHKRIIAGEPFEDVARELSTEHTAIDGGELGWVNPKTPFMPELLNVVMALDERELSEPIESIHGYHLFYAAEVEPEKRLAYKEVEKQIKEKIFEKGLTQQVEREAARLRQQTTVRYLDLAPYIGSPEVVETTTSG